MSFISRILNLQGGGLPNNHVPTNWIKRIIEALSGIDSDAKVLQDLWELYEKSSPISNVVNKRSSFCSSGNMYIEDKNGKQTDSDELISLLQNPNYGQVYVDFIRELITYISVEGYAYIYVNSNGMASQKISNKKIFALNPKYCGIGKVLKKRKLNIYNATSEDFDNLEFTYKDEANEFNVPFKSIIPIYDVCQTGLFKGISRIHLQKYNGSNAFNVAYGEGVILSKAGGMGIISQKSSAMGGTAQPLSPDEQKRIEDEIKSGYKIGDRIVTKGSVDYTSIIEPYEKFGFDKAFNLSKGEVLAAFNMPKEVYGSESSTYENQKEATKGYIQNEISPLMNKIVCDSLTSYFGYDKKNKKLVCDFSHLPIFATDKQQIANAYKTIAETIAILNANGQGNLAQQLIDETWS